MYYLRTLGETALYDSPSSSKPRCEGQRATVLGLLAAIPTHRAERKFLRQLLWPREVGSVQRNRLRQLIHSVRSSTDSTILEANDTHLWLVRQNLNVDLWQLDDALDAGDGERAVQLFTGRYLDGHPFDESPDLEWRIEADNAKLIERLNGPFFQVVRARLSGLRPETALDVAKQYVKIDPLNERAQSLLFECYTALGDEISAIATYEAYATELGQAIGGEPGEEFKARVARLRQAHPWWEPELDRQVRQPVRFKVANWTAAIGGVLLVIVSLGVAALWNFQSTGALPRPPASMLDSVSAQLFVALDRTVSDRLHQLSLQNGGTEIIRSTSVWLDLPSPDGKLIAEPRRGSVAIRRVVDSSVFTIPVDSGAQQQALDWSPDSRQLLFRRGIAEAADYYATSLHTYNVETRSVEQVISAETAKGLGVEVMKSGAWSPTGSYIAFGGRLEGNSEVFVAGADGEGITNISNHGADDYAPEWSADGSRIVFVRAGRERSRIQEWRLQDSTLSELLATESVIGYPNYVSEHVIAFLQDGDLWLASTEAERIRRVTDIGSLRTIGKVVPAAGGTRWIDQVLVEPPVIIGTPGQAMFLWSRVRLANGDITDSTGARVRFSTADSSIAKLSNAGVIRLHAVGRTWLYGEVGGWRKDSVSVTVTQSLNRADQIFVEDWTQGIDSARWSGFGEPRPFARPTGGPDDGGIFVNNGDVSEPSGAISRAAFPLDRGLTAEFWGRLPLTRRHYLNYVVGLTSHQPFVDPAEGLVIPHDVAFEIAGYGHHDDGPPGPIAHLRGPHEFPGPAIEIPPRPDDWHVYTLQVTPAGFVGLLVDGEPFWRLTQRIPVEKTSSLYLILGSRSYQTEVQHGPVRVTLGPPPATIPR